MEWFNSLVWKLRLSLLGEPVPNRVAKLDVESSLELSQDLLSLPISVQKPDWEYATMGPLLMGRLNLAMRAHFRSQGHGFFKINRMMEGFNPDTIQMAVAEADLTAPGTAAAFEQLQSTEAKIGAPAQGEPGSTGAIGDGTILQNLIAAIKTFAASDFGKALIAALEKALLGFLIP